MAERPEQLTDTIAVAHHLAAPPTVRALHVLVPEDAHRAARVAAAQSGLYFRDYITYLLRTAKPVSAVVQRN